MAGAVILEVPSPYRISQLDFPERSRLAIFLHQFHRKACQTGPTQMIVHSSFDHRHKRVERDANFHEEALVAFVALGCADATHAASEAVMVDMDPKHLVLPAPCHDGGEGGFGQSGRWLDRLERLLFLRQGNCLRVRDFLPETVALRSGSHGCDISRCIVNEVYKMFERFILMFERFILIGIGG